MNDPAISGAFPTIYDLLLLAMVVALIRRRNPAMGEWTSFVLTGGRAARRAGREHGGAP